MKRRPLPDAPTRPEAAAPLPPGVVHVSEPLAHLSDRFTLRLEEVARALGVSRRALERLRSAGRFPMPDLKLGRSLLWRPRTIHQWVERGGHP